MIFEWARSLIKLKNEPKTIVMGFIFSGLLETGGDSTVSEIEPQVVIEPFATVPPEITHQEMETFKIEDPSTIPTDAAEITSESNINPSPEIHQEQEENEVPLETQTQTTSSKAPQKKRRRKPDIQEDNNIDDEFASRLDMSCIEGTVAPTIVNAYIVEYAR